MDRRWMMMWGKPELGWKNVRRVRLCFLPCFFSDHFVANDPNKNSGKKGIQPMTMKPKCRTMISLSFARSSPEFFWNLMELLMEFIFNFLNSMESDSFRCYCWWKKSCTSWYGKYPIIYKLLYMPGGCLGFLPSTVCSNMIDPKLTGCFLICNAKSMVPIWYPAGKKSHGSKTS